MRKAAGGVREAFLEDVAISRSSGSLPGPTPYLNHNFLVVHAPLPPLTRQYSVLQPHDTTHNSQKGLGPP